jgi:Sap, sulfolipid-1-addressing protein
MLLVPEPHTSGSVRRGNDRPEELEPTSLEALILAVATALRPSTSWPAIYALTATATPPRLLLAYIAGGATVSVAFGVAVVAGSHGVHSELGDSNILIDLVGGALALGFAAGIWQGRVGGGSSRERDNGGRWSWALERLRRPSMRVAAGAGVATHVPGLFYLLALNSIASMKPGPADAVVQVLVYNAIWFSPAIGALVMSLTRPEQTRATLERVQDWGRRNRRVLATVVFGILGVFLLARGLIELLS